MTAVRDTESLTKSPTEFDPVGITSGWLANIIALEEPQIRSNREGWQLVEPNLVFMVGSSRRMVIEVQSDEVPAPIDVASLASSLEKVDLLPVYSRFHFFCSAAESPTTTTDRSWRRLQRVRRREELLQRLTPERRATYDRIRKLREDIGPLNFDVVEELRVLRENG